MQKTIFSLLTIGIALCVSGCGGSANPAPTAYRASIFVTDNLSSGYDHVWASIKKVELDEVTGRTVVVFNDPEGTTIDLRSLRDATGKRFKFLAASDDLLGEFDGVTVTLDDNVVLYATGATTGLPRIFQGSVNGEKVLTATITPARRFNSGDDDLILDFDLSQWSENGSEVTNASFLALDDDAGLHNMARHDHNEHTGTINALAGTAPNQTFTLTGHSTSFTVVCNASTVIHRSEDGGNPVLANGQRVEVRGIFSPATNRLDATRVKIEDAEDQDSDEAQGQVLDFNALEGSLRMSVAEAEHFLPVSNPINVTSTETTTYRSRSGVLITRPEFFALLEGGAIVEAEGNYSPVTNTLESTKMKLEGEDDEDDEVEIRGATSVVNTGSFTFTIAASNFSGINIPANTLIAVVTDGSTLFRGLSSGDSITRAEFFAALSNNPGQIVEVEGHWNGITLAAKKCKLED